VGARVTLFSVAPTAWQPPPPSMPALAGDTPPEWKRALSERLAPALEHELAGVPVERVAEAGDPALRIVAFAEANTVDLIMMPKHGLGLFRTFLTGSVTGKVLHDARCPVWTAAHADQQRSQPLPATVMCAVDGSAGTPALLAWTKQFCSEIQAQLKVLHVVSRITDWRASDRERELQEHLRHEARLRLEAIAAEAGLNAPLRVAVGDIVDSIAEDASEEEADLVIIGRGAASEPLGRLRGHAFGVVQRSPCPVLSV
jgi:nucleotide-binding universal stress UspA family protein